MKNLYCCQSNQPYLRLNNVFIPTYFVHKMVRILPKSNFFKQRKDITMYTN